jgi:hypothetical protein
VVKSKISFTFVTDGVHAGTRLFDNLTSSLQLN